MLSSLLLAYPEIDPVAVSLGPLAIRWYALAYVMGILLGWRYAAWVDRRSGAPLFTHEALDDMMLWAVAGVLLGGRLGYVLFYNPGFYIAHPQDILKVWEGGMSFHGGLLGVLLAFYCFSRRHKIAYLPLMDRLACATPIGLFFGRLANFINGELYGRPTDASWAMIFPQGGPEPRHPSQLYEAGLEGVALFLLLLALIRSTGILRRAGGCSGVFLAGYGLARFVVECFREPDAQLGLIAGFLSMGQVLCLPMLALGGWLIWRAAAQKKGGSESGTPEIER